MTYTLTQFWFNLYASYSGQRLYDDWYQAFYNLLFTSLPVIVVGLLDQDVSKVRLWAFRAWGLRALGTPPLYGI